MAVAVESFAIYIVLLIIIEAPPLLPQRGSDRGGAYFFLLYHLLHCCLYLCVYAAEHVLGCHIALNVGIELLVLQIVVAVVPGAHLRYAEGVLADILPPYGGHGAGYRCSDELAYAHLLVEPGSAVGIGVVILAYKHARGLYPTVEGVVAYELATWCVA